MYSKSNDTEIARKTAAGVSRYSEAALSPDRNASPPPDEKAALRKSPCTYILKCSDGTLYTGWTNDIKKRIAAHNAGKGSKYTRSRKPVELVHIEYYETKSEALKREAEIKKLSRKEKLNLICKVQKK